MNKGLSNKEDYNIFYLVIQKVIKFELKLHLKERLIFIINIIFAYINVKLLNFNNEY